MPNGVLSQALERMRQARARVASEHRGALTSASSAEARLGLRVVPGDRVLDLVTGLEGEVVAGHTETAVVQSAARRAG